MHCRAPPALPMFDPFKKLKLAGAFLGVADDAASPAAENLDIAELFGRLSLKDLRGMTLQAELLLDQPGVRPLFETHYMPPPEPLDRLAEMGEGTLGAEYVRYLRQYKLPQPQLPRRVDLDDPAVYLAQRVRMTHAMLHVITEYDASPLGELALQAYYIGQLGNLISGVIIASAILQITRDTPDLLGPALEVTSEAFQRGKQARSFLGVAWEELWSAQVPQLRELIDIPPRSSAVALLRLDTPKPPDRNDRDIRNDRDNRDIRNDRSSRSGSFSVNAFEDKEDGLVALGRSRSPSAPHVQAPPQREQPTHARGVFSGFNSTPVPDMPRSEPSRQEHARREPATPESRPRTSSTSAASSSLLASFMALAEQAQQPEPEPTRPDPKPTATPPKTAPTPSTEPRQTASRTEPRPDTRAPVKQPPPPPGAAKTSPSTTPPEPTYKVEEPATIAPAMSPDDPDYF